MARSSAIDTRLYDIVSKKLGVPAYNLLGGKVRQALPIYANGWTEGIAHTPEALAETHPAGAGRRRYTGCKFDPSARPPLN